MDGELKHVREETPAEKREQVRGTVDGDLKHTPEEDAVESGKSAQSKRLFEIPSFDSLNPLKWARMA
jgi:hypothetical protein